MPAAAEDENLFRKTSKLEVEYCESSLKNHSFQGECQDEVILFHATKLVDSLYIWIGYRNVPKFADLSLALNNKYDSQPICTRLIGDFIDEPSKNIALKLSKKLNKVVYVSLNINVNRFSIPYVNTRLQEEITKHPTYF